MGNNATGLVGRTTDVVSVLNAIGQSRLTTLLGPGGVGKTRLAREVGAELETEFAHIRFVDLAAPVIDPVVSSASSDEPTNFAALDAGSTLLIFDNCEHDIDRAGALVARVLGNTSSVRVLATSRRPLHTEGERVFPVRPLTVPLGEEAVSELSTYETVQLFVERVTQVDPDFVLKAAHAADVVRICQLSGGLPMLIELAAGLARSRSLASIAEAMSSGRDLVAKRRDIHPHQQTVGKSVDWSIALLGESARLVLECAATFRGSFTFQAIDFIHRAAGGEATLEPIDELVEHSLIQFSTDDNRYRVFEVIAGAVRNSCTAEQLGFYAATHLTWCEQIAEEVERRMYLPDPDQTFVAYRHELANLAWAASQLAEDEDYERWLNLVGAIAVWWVNHGGPADLDLWTKIHGQAPPSASKVSLALAIAFRLGHSGNLEKMASYAEVARRELDDLGRPDLEIATLWVAASANQGLGKRPEAVQLFEQALATYELAAPTDDAPSSYLLGLVRVGLAEALESPVGKREQLTLVLELARFSYPALHIAATQVLAKLELGDGNFDRVTALLEPNIDVAIEIGFFEAAGTSHNIIGLAARLAANPKAEDHYRHGIRYGQRIGHSGVIADGLVGLAELCVEAGLHDLGASLAQSAQVLSPEIQLSEKLAKVSREPKPRVRASDVNNLLNELSTPIGLAQSPGVGAAEVRLTDRELSVLRLLRGDLTQREIADELYISASTVRTHVKSIYKKLGVHNRSGCVYEATVLGLLASPG